MSMMCYNLGTEKCNFRVRNAAGLDNHFKLTHLAILTTDCRLTWEIEVIYLKFIEFKSVHALKGG